MGLANGVGAGRDAGEQISAGGVGAGCAGDRVAAHAHTSERNRHARDAVVERRAQHPILIHIAEDRAGDIGQAQLTKRITGCSRTHAEGHGHRIVVQRPTHAAQRIPPIIVASRLHLLDDVCAGGQIAKDKLALRRSRGGDAQVAVRRAQDHRRTRQTQLRR